MTTSLELNRMVVGCIEKLKRAGFKVESSFSATSYNYVFVATGGGIKSFYRLTTEEQTAMNYDNFFKWAAELLSSALHQRK